jgi:threonine/homoserine/homoserine lactone efflux protein
MNYASFLPYVFLTAFTPGPNNIMCLGNSTRLGFKKSLPFCFGVFAGGAFIISLCAAFMALLDDFAPRAQAYMKWVSAGYLLLLAVTILRDKPHAEGKKPRFRPESFLAGVVMQFVNVKVIMYGITTLSIFILPHYQDLPSIALWVAFLAAAGLLSTFCWTAFGSIFQRFFEKRGKLINAIMAALLAYYAISSIIL